MQCIFHRDIVNEDDVTIYLEDHEWHRPTCDYCGAQGMAYRSHEVAKEEWQRQVDLVKGKNPSNELIKTRLLTLKGVIEHELQHL